MKLSSVFLTFGILSSPIVQAEVPKFSAFAYGDQLFITVIGDSCNHMGGFLEVDPTCRQGRTTKNWALECSAKVMISMTEMFCNDKKPVARVVEMSLADNKVASEAKVLLLTYAGQEVEVQLK